MRSGHTLSGGIIPPASNTMCDLLVHDVRSALASINGYAQSLQRRLANRQPDPDDVVQGLQRIETAAGGVESLLEELARLVDRDDLSHLEPHHTPVDLAAPRAAPDERGLRALPRVYVSCGAAVLTNASTSAASQASPT